jgi:hypothetical protein
MSTGRFDQNKFYVYVYLDPLEPGIFTCEDIAFKFKLIYVGKGDDPKQAFLPSINHQSPDPPNEPWPASCRSESSAD